MAKVPPGGNDPRFIPALEMLARTGATEVQVRYSDDEQPVIWMIAACWSGRWEAAGGMTPLAAAFRLCDAVVDGGTCVHCGQPTGFVPDIDPMPLAGFCWYQWDPELKTFRRSCADGITPETESKAG